MRSRFVFGRHATAELPVAVGGDGPYLIDSDGKRYLDACGGAAVSCLGHSAHAVARAAAAQLERMPYAHTAFFTSEPAELLAERLADRAPMADARVYFVSGGSEATEAAIKLARQYHLERGAPERVNVIARWQSYHGNTLGALAAGGNRWRRAQFAPMLSDAFHHVDACHYWRWGAPGESAEAYGERVAGSLAAKIEELGPETVCAFIVEPVVGATMGAVPAAPGYFARIREICDRYGVVMICDEVMCGMGRTGALFASELENVEPDIVCVAKGLGAGLQPVGAMIASGKVFDAIAGGSGFFHHGHTYIGHPVACAAAGAVLDEIEGRSLLEAARRQGDFLRAALEDRFRDHPHVGDIRGRGLLVGVELVLDRDSKEPFDPAARLAASVKRAAMARGLMCYPNSGTIDGRRGDHILLAPPFIVEEAHLAELVDKLAPALDDAIG